MPPVVRAARTVLLATAALLAVAYGTGPLAMRPWRHPAAAGDDNPSFDLPWVIVLTWIAITAVHVLLAVRLHAGGGATRNMITVFEAAMLPLGLFVLMPVVALTAFGYGGDLVFVVWVVLLMWPFTITPLVVLRLTYSPAAAAHFQG